MKEGAKAECVDPRGYDLTKNKTYNVLGYQPEYQDGPFKGPAYVKVMDDYGREVWCHAHRFEEEEE